MKIGTTRTVSYEDSRRMRREGWMTRNDVVVMMYVGKPEGVPSNISIAAKKGAEAFKSRGWAAADHAFVARKIAGESA